MRRGGGTTSFTSTFIYFDVVEYWYICNNNRLITWLIVLVLWAYCKRLLKFIEVLEPTFFVGRKWKLIACAICGDFYFYRESYGSLRFLFFFYSKRIIQEIQHWIQLTSVASGFFYQSDWSFWGFSLFRIDQYIYRRCFSMMI